MGSSASSRVDDRVDGRSVLVKYFERACGDTRVPIGEPLSAFEPLLLHAEITNVAGVASVRFSVLTDFPVGLGHQFDCAAMI